MEINIAILQKKYPICDTDIWVDINLGGILTNLFEKYEKIIIADVVQNEILKFSSNRDFSFIAEEYRKNKKAGNIIVIHHEKIEESDRILLERQLVDCDNRFRSGLADDPHEKNKGEIVSAIYAEYFEIPFLKSNDHILMKER